MQLHDSISVYDMIFVFCVRCLLIKVLLSSSGEAKLRKREGCDNDNAIRCSHVSLTTGTVCY